MNDSLDITILLPCLNEAETLATCIKKAQKSFMDLNLKGEVLIADNGSTDGSQVIAQVLGARVISVVQKGYGSALLAGIEAAKSEYIIMADADDSYALDDISLFVDALRNQGADLVMGNRFKGGIAEGAMPWLHRYIGNPVLSFLGRLFFGGDIGDFHCGMRGFNRATMLKLGLTTTGMEFASELVVKSRISGAKILEVPTKLKKDGRSRKPHLRTWRDGWRHLRFLLSFSPRWLFLYPGTAFLVIGLIGVVVLSGGPVHVGRVSLDVQTLVFSGGSFLVGQQLIWFAILAKGSSVSKGALPEDETWKRIIALFSRERNLLLFSGIFLIGLVLAVASFLHWKATGFSQLNPDKSLRASLIAFVLIFTGIQSIFFHFLLGVIFTGTETSSIKWEPYLATNSKEN